MPYDLYGTYYASARDAENAEMAQCAAIDADIANRKVAQLERQLQNRQYEQTPAEYEVARLADRLERLIAILNSKGINLSELDEPQPTDDAKDDLPW